MNELIAPLYWLFKKDRDQHSQRYAEADAFWCALSSVAHTGRALPDSEACLALHLGSCGSCPLTLLATLGGF